jgi:hypothetical protein
MPRKELPRFVIELALHDEDRVAADVLEMMGRFEEIVVLDTATARALADALIKAVRRARLRWPTRRPDVSGLEWKQEILASDVGAAMRQAGLAVRSWRRDTKCRDPMRGEALFYRVLRATAASAGFSIPVDAYGLFRRAEEVKRVNFLKGAPNAPRQIDSGGVIGLSASTRRQPT